MQTCQWRSDRSSKAQVSHTPPQLYWTLLVKQSRIPVADFYNDLYTGEIDTATGFSLVASEQTCFVWQHAQVTPVIVVSDAKNNTVVFLQAMTATPTCYIFSCPRDVKQSGPPLHALVPYGPSREPGLILVSPSGEVRFWYGIGIGLAGGDNYSTTTLTLSAGEYVTNLVRSDVRIDVTTEINDITIS